MAAHQPKPREFSRRPQLHLALPNRARLFASAWVTSRPTVIIRRNRLVDAGLHGLVSAGLPIGGGASFLSAVVQARMSLVVSGDQGTGKTTMLRALAHGLPAHVQIGTIETEYELYLKDTRDHQVVHEWQANPAPGRSGSTAAARRVHRPRGPRGLSAGELVVHDRGEVRGSEIVTVFKCMQSGSGSMSTTCPHGGGRSGSW